MISPPPQVGIFCNPESRRVEGFSIALGKLCRQRPVLMPWQWVLDGDPWARRLRNDPTLLRLESPGRNWGVEKGFLTHGWSVRDEESAHQWRVMPLETIRSFSPDRGRILPMRQWFLGWRQTLLDLEHWAGQCQDVFRWMCPPKDVICMFDKAACQKVLETSGIRVPPMLGVPLCFAELWESMKSSGRRRVFIKPCHGSSASGVVALETSRTEMQAFSTLEVTENNGELQLFNQRRIRKYSGQKEVQPLLEAVLAERCIAQVWVPKAGFQGRPFDLRVVVVKGRARNIMMRLGRGPMTNSQLLGGKGEVQALRLKMGEECWTNMLQLCETAMTRCFPKCLYAGLDVLIEPGFKTAMILEVNAFGDLLPRELHENRDTYEWEILGAIQNG